MGGHVLAHLLRDARFSVRLLGRTPAHTLVAIITLALGISATTAIFSVVYGTFFAPLPYIQSDRLVMLWEQDRGQRRQVSPRNYLAWKRLTGAFADVNAWSGRSVNIATDDRPENVNASIATPGFLPMLGYGHPLALGRTFSAEEGLPGHDNVVILTWQLWQDRFGGDPRIVGRQIRLDDKPYTVIGVLGKGAADRTQSKVWLPLAFTDGDLKADNQNLNVMGRLADGVSIGEANARVAALSAAIERDRSQKREGWTVSVEAFRNNFVRDTTKRGIWLLLGAVLFLLLIACANVANLLLSRAAARQREMAVRVALGASRGRLAQQLLTESLFLASLGGIAGFLFAWTAIAALSKYLPADLSRAEGLTVDARMMVFTALISLLTGILFGLAPLFGMRRVSAGESLKHSNRIAGGTHAGLRNALAVAQIAIAIILLIGAGLMLRSVLELGRVNPGFDPNNVLTFLLQSRARLPEERATFNQQVRERLLAIPGVTAATAATPLPLDGQLTNGRWGTEAAASDPSKFRQANFHIVLPGYFEAMRTRLIAGRLFTEADNNIDQKTDMPRQIIVDDSLAALAFRGEPAVGKRLLLRITTPEAEWYEVIGVVAHQRHSSLAAPGPEAIFIANGHFGHGAAGRWAVRTSGDPNQVVAAVRAAVAQVDSRAPLAEVQPMTAFVDKAMAPIRFTTTLIGIFAAVAMLLAAIGLYGVLSTIVRQRTAEIGMRMVFGAPRSSILNLVVGEGLKLSAIGTLIGFAGALAITRVMASMLVGVNPTDPLTFAVIVGIFGIIAVTASWIPARRASRLDPMAAIREE